MSLSFSGSTDIRVRVNSTNLTVGTYNTTVRTLTARNDNSVVDIKDIPLSYTVTNATVASPSSLQFNMVAGNAPAPQSITLSNGGNPVTPTSATNYSSSSWFTVSLNGNAVDVSTTAAALSLSPGNYTGLVRIVHPGGTIIPTVRLTVTAQTLTVSPDLTFVIDTSTQAADLTQTVTVGTNFIPAGAVDWSASVFWGGSPNQWLTVTPASGDTQSTNTFSVTIDPSEIGDLLNRWPNNGQLIDHTVDITISSTTPGVQSATLTVTLNIDYPHALTVSPNVAVTGATEEFILRGWGFSGLTSQILYCGAQAATSYTVLSDVEVRATCPALAAGNYEMRFDDTLGVVRDHPSLYVEGTVGYIDEVIASTGTKSRIIYDAVQKAIYMANTEDDRLDRLTYNDAITVGSKWVADNTAINGMASIALATDGSYMYAVRDNLPGGYVTKIDIPNILQNYSVSVGGARISNNLAFLSGGEALVTFGPNASSYSPLRFKHGAASGSLNPVMENAVVGATRDGRRAIVASKDATPAADVYYHDSALAPTMNPASMVSAGLSRNADIISSDRTGTKWIFDHVDVYTDQFILLGSLPVTTLASIMSHDGTIAFTVDSGGTVRKFDLTSVTAQLFTEIGTGTVLAATPGANPVMTISHDGGRLFIAGDQNVVIITSP